MEDTDIIRLYWDRSDRAIRETAEKYGHYCKSIARNILGSEEDAEECVNDTWLRAWNAMPDCWPDILSAFLGRITRNLSLNRCKHRRAEKRGGSEMALILDELADCVSGAEDVEQTVDRRELAAAVDDFVRGLPAAKRSIFVRRYWYADPVAMIARRQGMTRAGVSKALERMRRQLKTELEGKGFLL